MMNPETSKINDGFVATINDVTVAGDEEALRTGKVVKGPDPAMWGEDAVRPVDSFVPSSDPEEIKGPDSAFWGR